MANRQPQELHVFCLQQKFRLLSCIKGSWGQYLHCLGAANQSQLAEIGIGSDQCGMRGLNTGWGHPQGKGWKGWWALYTDIVETGQNF